MAKASNRIYSELFLFFYLFLFFSMRGTYFFVFEAQHVGTDLTSVAQLVWDSKASDTVYLVRQR